MAEREALPEALLDTLYRVASDPDTWEELVDALPETALDPRSLDRDLQRGIEIARRVSSRPASPAPARATLRLDARLAVQALGGQAADLMGAIAVGRRLPMADEDSEHALRLAMDRAGRTGTAVIMFRLAGIDGPLVGRLSAEPAGVMLSFSRTETGDAADALGLTPAEARLVGALSDADGLKGAADQLGVSVNTARNQLASIFEKLGVRSQADLARLVGEVARHERPAPGADADPWPRRETMILRDGRRLAYRVYGDGSAARSVMTFHDGLGSSLVPLETGPIARQAGLRVISAERPGFGGSDPLRDYSLETVAADMEELRDRLALAEPALVGLLAGAAPMLATAARFGARARKAVILSGRPPREPRDAGGNPLLRFRASMVRHPRLAQAAFAILGTRISPKAVERMLRRAGKGSPGDLALLAEHPEIAAFLSRSALEALEGGGSGPAAELAISGAAPSFHLAGVSAPLEVFHGEEDALSPLGLLQAYLGDRPYALTVYPGIGQLMALRHWGAILAGL
ncbi:MAG: alpha/beta fold hydrolase [Phenylobacterium sp.]|uniref:alpha/beta fold hydrolase n=1 Tax=Phenylobacterium sp. TaxID=1871053 RepID=UPI001A516CC7|nr:alpha/beta fold hydrolase [Phenylobacterium sp.]MBL8555689.1 alpha/beta fold hydrolase [Phenylobacterium sp.]